jgi:hypothetical protein
MFVTIRATESRGRVDRTSDDAAGALRAARHLIVFCDGAVRHRHPLSRRSQIGIAVRKHHFEHDQLLPTFDRLCPFGRHPITGRGCFVGDPELVVHGRSEHSDAAMCSDNQRVRLTHRQGVTGFERREKGINRICRAAECLGRILIGAACSQNSDSNGQSQPQTSLTPHDIDNSRRPISRRPRQMLTRPAR